MTLFRSLTRRIGLLPGDEDREVNRALRDVDAAQRACFPPAPILSALVRHDDGSMCSVFWESVDKYALRQPGEQNAELIARLRDEAFAWAAKKETL